MKKYLLLLFLFLFTAFAGYGQPAKNQAAKNTSAILKVLEDQRLAWNRGNIEEYMQGYWQSDSLLFVGKNGPKYGWQNTLDNYKKAYPNKETMGFLTFDIKEVRMMDKQNAFVLGAWYLKREKDEPQGFFTLLLKKVKGEWRVIADHSS